MTELLIVSKPRGRIHKWIYGQYKEYLNPVSLSFQDNLTLLIDATGAEESTYNTQLAQRFRTPNGTEIRIKQVSLWLRNPDPTTYTGTIYVELWSDQDGSPGSKIADIGTIDQSTMDTAFAEYSFNVDLLVQPNTYYWIYVYVDPAYEISYWEKSTSDVYMDGYAWKGDGTDLSAYDFHMKLIYDGYYDVNLDFIYDGAAEKRLQIDFTSSTGLEKIIVNDQDTGSDLLKEESIPQADNYTIRFEFTQGADVDLSGSIQRWLYFNKTSITLDDLNFSEAYIQEIEYGSDGGVLRIDDDPAGDLVGSANETIQFTDILVPFRKLEWISGGGEVLILGVE